MIPNFLGILIPVTKERTPQLAVPREKLSAIMGRIGKAFPASLRCKIGTIILWIILPALITPMLEIVVLSRLPAIPA